MLFLIPFVAAAVVLKSLFWLREGLNLNHWSTHLMCGEHSPHGVGELAGLYLICKALLRLGSPFGPHRIGFLAHPNWVWRRSEGIAEFSYSEPLSAAARVLDWIGSDWNIPVSSGNRLKMSRHPRRRITKSFHGPTKGQYRRALFYTPSPVQGSTWKRGILPLYPCDKGW